VQTELMRPASRVADFVVERCNHGVAHPGLKGRCSCAIQIEGHGESPNVWISSVMFATSFDKQYVSSHVLNVVAMQVATAK
jgi:hypothetical protein